MFEEPSVLNLQDRGPELTDDLKERFASVFGFAIPLSLTEFWQVYGNGGNIIGSLSIKFWDGFSSHGSTLHGVLGIGHPFSYLSIERSKGYQPPVPSGFLDFSFDGLGNRYLIKIAEPRLESVWFFDHELDENGMAQKPIQIADSLMEFVSRLYVYVPNNEK